MNIPIPLQPLVLADRNLHCSSAFYRIEQASPRPTFPQPHSHDCYELYVNISGDVSFLVNDKLYAVQSGDLIIARPGEMHVCIVQSPCLYESCCFWFYSQRTTPLTAFADIPDMHHHIRFQASDRMRLKEIMQRIYQAEADNNEMERTAWVYHLLALLNGTTEPELVSVPAPLPDKLQEILTYINSSFSELHSVTDIARCFYISTATLTRWFREHLKMTPKSYLEARRLAYSKDLLLRGFSVTDVSNITGFSNCSRFIYVFRKMFGVTPLQYQKSLRSFPERLSPEDVL